MNGTNELDALIATLTKATADERCIRRSGWDPHRQRLDETVFSVANGQMGIRPSAGPDALGSSPGSFLVDLYGSGLAVPQELVKVPSWCHLELVVGGEECPLGDESTKLERTLLVPYGLTHLRLTTANPSGQLAELEWWIGAHRTLGSTGFAVGRVRAIGHDAPIELRWGIDGRAGNGFLGGEEDAIVVRHCELDLVETWSTGTSTTWGLKGTDRTLIAAVGLVAAPTEPARVRLLRDRVELTTRIRAEGSGAFGLIAELSHHPSGKAGNGRDLVDRDASHLHRLVDQHLTASHELWDRFAIRIEGDDGADEGARFGTFHLLQQLPSTPPTEAQITSRGLTSEYHSGHVFFNSELYVVPWLILVWPEMARSLIVHRLNRLGPARSLAHARGYEGAMYPEEAALDGSEAAAREITDIFTGTTAVEWSGLEVVHLSADVAWAIDRYLGTTGDTSLLDDGAAEALGEIARFICSRVTWEEHLGGFTALQVMGPDEFHYHVDGNAYTNAMFAAALRIAARWVRPGVIESEEIDGWSQMAEQIWIPPPDEHGLVEQFVGYFDLPDQVVTTLRPNGLPQLETTDQRTADRLEPFRTRLVKQADVVMLMALLPEAYDDATAAANLAYYEPRTVHDSSLSFAPHALVAARVGDLDRARDHLVRSLRYDLDYSPAASFANGLHLAAYAGGLAVIMRAFAGWNLGRPGRADRSLPSGWTSLHCSGVVDGSRCQVSVTSPNAPRGPRTG